MTSELILLLLIDDTKPLAGVLLTELVHSLYRLSEHRQIRALRIVLGRNRILFETQVHAFGVNGLQTAENAVCGDPEFSVLLDVVCREELRALLFPRVGWLSGTADLPGQQVRLKLVKLSREWSDLIRGQQYAAQSKHRALVELRCVAPDVGADMTKLIKVCDVEHKHESLRSRVGLGKGAPRATRLLE